MGKKTYKYVDDQLVYLFNANYLQSVQNQP